MEFTRSRRGVKTTPGPPSSSAGKPWPLEVDEISPVAIFFFFFFLPDVVMCFGRIFLVVICLDCGFVYFLVVCDTIWYWLTYFVFR